MFGSKTEHYIPEDDTPSLFPEEEEEAPIEKAPQKVSEHERRVRQPNALSEIPSDLPREERIIDVPEEKRQGMTLIGYEESERIAYRTGLYVIHFKRAKYADPSDALRGVVTWTGIILLVTLEFILFLQMNKPLINLDNRIYWPRRFPGVSRPHRVELLKGFYLDTVAEVKVEVPTHVAALFGNCRLLVIFKDGSERLLMLGPEKRMRQNARILCEVMNIQPSTTSATPAVSDALPNGNEQL